MAGGQAADPARPARRPPAHGARARGAERDRPPALDRLPVGHAAEGPAAEEHGPGLLLALGLGWHAGAHPPRPLRRGPRAVRGEASPTTAIIGSQATQSAPKEAPRSISPATTRPRRSSGASAPC